MLEDGTPFFITSIDVDSSFGGGLVNFVGTRPDGTVVTQVFDPMGDWATFELNELTGVFSNVTSFSSDPNQVFSYDNISVHPVPEPRSVALFLVGAAIVGTAVRRQSLTSICERAIAPRAFA